MTESVAPSTLPPVSHAAHMPREMFLAPQCAAGCVVFAGAGPGALDHLTLGALRAILDAEVVIFDRLVGQDILAQIPDHAKRIDVGKEGFGPSVSQTQINRHIVTEAKAGRKVLRLKGGDPAIFGRLDEEIDALAEAGIAFQILPGLTTASVAAAAIGQSLTKRGRNTSLRIVTGHDMAGYAEQDWRALARLGEVAAIYMGKKSARFIQGRLMMHGAHAQTPVTLIENVSRPTQRIHSGALHDLPHLASRCEGPALIFLGLAPRKAYVAISNLNEAQA